MSKVHASKPKSSGIGAGKHNVMVIPKIVPRRLQNFLLIWLDANLDESVEDFQQSLLKLRRIVASVNRFTDVQKCFHFLHEITEEKVFMIVSGALGKQIVPKIEKLSQLDAIYVFCRTKGLHEPWANKILKVKGVYTEIEPICEALKVDRENCDRATISISFNGIDPLFMYTQFLKEALLQIEDNNEISIKQLVKFCRLQNDIVEDEIEMIEHKYHHYKPIWWYTSPYFMHSLLNRGLRLMDTDIILNMGFFMRHLHNHIQYLYKKQQYYTANIMVPFKVYRGQGLLIEKFHQLKKAKDNMMSFNNFLSTSRNRKICIDHFARPATFNTNVVGILFVMIVDPKICRKSSIPFADVKDVGYFKDQEEEILFTTHTIFRINSIQHMQDGSTDRLWEVNLTLVGNENHELNSLISHLHGEFNTVTGWSRLAYILLKVGEYVKSQELYQILLRKATTDADRATFNFQLGRVYDNLGKYSKAITHYKEHLDYKTRTLSPNHPDLALSYNNIGIVYYKMGEYTKALLSYKRSFEIRKIASPPNHPDLALSYNNIGLVYYSMGKYSKALSSYKQSLAIMRNVCPSNHPDFAKCYNNIGEVYRKMGEYLKAISSYERCFEIQKIALPPNHPSLASTYGNLGNVYNDMGEYSKALSSHERCLAILRTSLPENHQEVALAYLNIGDVYVQMGEYSKALSSLERCFEIQKIVLLPNHPEIAILHLSIGTVYDKMGEYTKALSSCKRCLEIQKIVFPPNHLEVAGSYNTIGLVYVHMGEYSKALSSYQRCLEIQKIALPENHVYLAYPYHGIGLVYSKMGDYAKARFSFERAIEIREKVLAKNHPDLAKSYNDIGLLYYSMGHYVKALQFLEKGLEIRQKSLPAKHPDIDESKRNIENVRRKMK